MPWPVKTSHLEQMTLCDRLLAAEAHVAVDISYDVIVLNALLYRYTRHKTTIIATGMPLCQRLKNYYYYYYYY